ncbi:hypothetical protein HBI56_096680 [Parastagonospora nodorum]|nr:hypothetical protein HBH54_026700 [Parastagonospora nodorum]KAH3940449.1 hypothetical protein HBH53_216800 [Parastagonospora nodorum]KAH3998034.1 hypothetical protein HBI10_129490 [Parastagonospora nodorum]KAH4030199.1 hypothetical protein HBI13_038090 [Parastagonospora nodorum]KAH4034442.1 hypothetical protein HBI09_110570 [Parastagonospora nodorum]
MMKTTIEHLDDRVKHVHICDEDAPLTEYYTVKHLGDKSILGGSLSCKYIRQFCLARPKTATVVAVKRYAAPVLYDFLHERQAFCYLNELHNKHINKLLATYTHGKEHFMVFQIAETDLDGLWLRTDSCQELKADIRWFLRETKGLASALSDMHDLIISKSAHPITGFLHGDIKPSNILVTQDKTLVWNDFELSAWSGGSPPRITTRTYSAPETQLWEEVTQASDIWSFGCVILEFVLWLLRGSEGLEKFAQERIMATPGSTLPFKDDQFFMQDYSESEVTSAKVRATVKDYAHSLRSDKRCCQVLKDTLNLVMQYMLVVQQEDRKSAGQIAEAFEAFVAKQEKTLH